MKRYVILFLVTKGQVHEGIIQISTKGSVITWDFDVLRHDVVFTVFRWSLFIYLLSWAKHSIQ